MDRIDVPAAWEESAARIAAEPLRRILVIGATDRGKSTYCGFLIRRLRSTGAGVAFVDADIGQKDVGPPATITLAYAEADREITQVTPAGLYFVGAVTPIGHFPHMIVGTRRMVDAAEAPFVVINTTGLVHGAGRVLKALQIESLQPSAIVALERNDELAAILKAHRHHRILCLPCSACATTKSAAARSAARALAFGHYFRHASELELDATSLVFQRSPVFNGTPVDDPRFLYAERTPEGIVAVSEQAVSHAPKVTLIPAGFERSLLCGIADRRGDAIGLGIIRHIDFARRRIALLTPVPPQAIKIIQFGALHLAPDGTALPGSKVQAGFTVRVLKRDSPQPGG